MGCLIMGYGDELMGSGLAKGAHARGKRIAFGNRRRIIWKPPGFEVYAGNPNVAPPGAENDPDIEWIEHYPGHRLYMREPNVVNGHYQLIPFTPTPGEIFFSDQEQAFAQQIPADFILVHPLAKHTMPNKRWPLDRYHEVSKVLGEKGYRVRSFNIGDDQIQTKTFREAVAALSRALLYIGPEGGLHHGSAAVGTKAVVLFGGFPHPATTGYPDHTNIAVNPGCGSIAPCAHCKQAMESIAVDQVIDAALEQLSK